MGMLQLLLLAAALQLQLAAAGAHLDHDATAVSVGLAAIIEQSRDVQAVPLAEPDWIRVQARYEAEVECKVQHGEVLDAVFYGDSIVEALRGNFRGRPYSKALDQPAVWARHFGSWNALPLGISGDRTLNLLWRLREGGEAPAGLRARSAVVLIGTNDFFNHHEQATPRACLLVLPDFSWVCRRCSVSVPAWRSPAPRHSLQQRPAAPPAPASASLHASCWCKARQGTAAPAPNKIGRGAPAAALACGPAPDGRPGPRLQLYGAVPMSEVETIVSEAVAGILAVTAALQERLPRAHVLLLGLLPRGDVERGRWDAFHWEQPSMFSPHIKLVNERLAEFAAAARHVSFLDCGHVLLTPAGDALDPALVYDGLHPSARGADALLACVKPHLQPPRRRGAELPDA